MTDEAELVASFASSRSDRAFEAIVQLHFRFVFATAYRQLENRELAEEVTQNVFIVLAQKAHSMKGHRTLAGWLYQTTLNQSRHILRTDLRRRTREDIAARFANVS